ncbi:MAG: DUF1573 domain-containing protein [Flavobacterium sp.]
MKLKFLTLALVSVLAFNANAQTEIKKTKKIKKTTKVETTPTIALENVTTSSNMPAVNVNWKSLNHDFGEIKKGVPASHEFTFVNTSKEVVIITKVQPACGCTASDYTKTPIRPGETGKVLATFNAAAAGPFTKSVTVNLNDQLDKPVTLTFKGNVVEPQSK